jgi:hypothetical protein
VNASGNASTPKNPKKHQISSRRHLLTLKFSSAPQRIDASSSHQDDVIFKARCAAGTFYPLPQKPPDKELAYATIHLAL